MITQANDISSTDDILTQEEFLASLQKAEKPPQLFWQVQNVISFKKKTIKP